MTRIAASCGSRQSKTQDDVMSRVVRSRAFEAALIVFTLAMVASGLVLSGSRSLQVKSLSEKLKSFEEEM